MPLESCVVGGAVAVCVGRLVAAFHRASGAGIPVPDALSAAIAGDPVVVIPAESPGYVLAVAAVHGAEAVRTGVVGLDLFCAPVAGDAIVVRLAVAASVVLTVAVLYGADTITLGHCWLPSSTGFAGIEPGGTDFPPGSHNATSYASAEGADSVRKSAFYVVGAL